MKMKKILASVAAAALAVSAMSVASFAKEITVNTTYDPYIMVAISTGEVADYTVNWAVATIDDAAAFEGSVTLAGGEWWAQTAFNADNLSDFIGDVDPDDITSITLTSDTPIFFGYNNTSADWTQPDAATEIVIEDVSTIAFESYDAQTTVDAEAYTYDPANGTYVTTLFQDAESIADDAEVTATVYVLDEDVDTSAVQVYFNAFTSSWTGWTGIKSDEGTLTLTATVAELAEVLGDDVFGVNLEILGLAEGATAYYTVDVTGVTAKTEDDGETEDGETEDGETEDGETEDGETENGDADDSANGDTDADTGDDKNQETGVVLAVIPAAVAAAGVIIAKKRK